MRKIIITIFLISLLVNAFLIYLLLKPEQVDRTPPWHPFELNSELTLESIVEDGYRFVAMPCGQVQYLKQVGDTSIQYEVEVDCNKYVKKFRAEPEFNGEDIPEDTATDSSKKAQGIEEVVAENKYYPWYPEEIKGCYQNINWRVFTISLGPKIDTLALRKYIEQNGGYIMESTENWNSPKGGSFMVHHFESKLYFHCTVRNENIHQSEEVNWQFRITRHIPHLDQKSIMKEKERRRMIFNYYEEHDDWD